MTGSPHATPQLYTAAEVAAMLRCSQWWVKEQARCRRIPFCWIGGSYRFTDEHITTIVRLFEKRPMEHASVPSVEPLRRSITDAESSGSRLVARVPRRTRLARKGEAA